MSKENKVLKLLMYDGCNLKCNFCHNEFQGNKSGERLRHFKFDKANLELFFSKYSINTVKYSGGEPLLNFDELVNVLRFFSEEKNIKDNIILTNLAAGKTSNLEMLVDYGITEFRVNIPSFDEQEYIYTTRIDSLEKVKKRCILLGKLNTKIRLQCVIDDETLQPTRFIGRYIKSALSLGVSTDISFLVSARCANHEKLYGNISIYLSDKYQVKGFSNRATEYDLGGATINLTRCSEWTDQEEVEQSDLYITPPGVELNYHSIGRAYND